MLAAAHGENETARTHFHASLPLWRALGDDSGVGQTQLNLAEIACAQGDYAAARDVAEESVALLRTTGDLPGLAWALLTRTMVSTALEEDGGDALAEEALAIFRTRDEPTGVAQALATLADALRAEGRRDEALGHWREALVAFRALSNRAAVAACLEGGAGTLLELPGDPRRALRLAGAAAALRDALGATWTFLPAGWLVERLAHARHTLSPDEADAAWREGQSVSWERAVAAALAECDAARVRPVREAATLAATSLSARELEVAALVARGCSNREIAEQLVITPGTARVHVAHILDKLGLRTRAQIAAWATERRLASV